jgi:hypothetical protein
MDLPAPAGPDCIRRIKVWTPDEMGNGGAFRVALPPWGYLEGVELRLRELVPNMDANNPRMLNIGISEPWGSPPAPMDVVAVVRDVIDSRGADPYRDSRRPGDTTLACPHCGETLRGHLELIHRRAEV